MIEYHTRNDCRLCKNLTLSKVMHFPATPIGDDFITKNNLNMAQNVYPLDLSFCTQCGLLQIPNVVSPELLYRNYIYETNSSLNLSNHFQSYANAVIDHLKLPEGSTIFEIGCNDGTLLSCFNNKKMKTIGIEPAIKISQKATLKGLEIINDFFSLDLSQSLKKKFGEADLICANNVLANIDDLENFFKGISNLLKPNGTFVFESGYMIDLVNNDVIDNIYHEHLSYFSIYPLVKNLHSHGLKLFHVEHINTKGGSMRYFIKKIDGPQLISSEVKKWLDQEISMNFDKVSRYEELSIKHNAEKEKLLKLLSDLKSQGKKIAGYGASVGVTTLLYFYEVESYISFLADDNASRQGLYSPGFHIPVYHSSRLIEENIDYVVCFPWRYLVPIKENNQAFLARGGKFILPLPHISIV